jgi:BlaI family transcriptional regulator, penicillinase repressor
VRLTNRETDLMNVLWEHGPCTVAEVHARLGDKLAYTTVLSVLRGLESKGSVTRSKVGRAHRYAPRVTRETACRRAVAALTAKFFRSSTESLLVHLLEHERLGEVQVARLRALLARHQRDTR